MPQNCCLQLAEPTAKALPGLVPECSAAPSKPPKPAWGFGQQNIFQALVQTPPWPPSQHRDSILQPP